MAARKKLGLLLRGAGEAMRAVEWVDSGDTSPPSDINAIEKLFTEIKGMD
jgi:hypothetical protein